MANPAARLFQVPLEEFTAARNALVRELRKAGQEEDAKRVAGLRKPSRALWLVNQLAREAAKPLEALISATRKTREAQQQGRAGSDLRATMHEQREALEQLLAAAAKLETAALPQAIERRMHDTLQSAAASEPDALREGRLEHELLPAGFDAVFDGATLRPAEKKAERPEAASAAKKGAAKTKGEGASKEDAKAAAKAEAAAAKAAAVAQEEERRRQSALKAAEKAAARLDAAAAKLEQAAAQAEASAKKLRDKAQTARTEADEAAAKTRSLRGA
jgi:hypothetical protein